MTGAADREEFGNPLNDRGQDRRQPVARGQLFVLSSGRAALKRRFHLYNISEGGGS